MNTIDMTPTWQNLLPAMLVVLKQGKNKQSVELIQQELARMAKAADLWNQHIGSFNPDSVTPKEN
jgi:hypothetical protein